jgi:hypothetical protein
MMQAPAIYSQCVPDTPQQASYIHHTPQQASYAQKEPHQTTYMPQICILPQKPNYTIHNPNSNNNKQSTKPNSRLLRSGRKVLTAMTMMTSYPGKQSVEEVRKEQAPEPQKCQ